MNNFDDKRSEKERSDYKFYRKNKTIYIEVYGSSFSKPISRTKKSVVWMLLSIYNIQNLSDISIFQVYFNNDT